MNTEVQVFDGEGIDWVRELPEGPHMATVAVVGYSETCRIWVQQSADKGKNFCTGSVRFLDLNPESQIATYLNTMLSKRNNRKTMNESKFVMVAGAWKCIGCAVDNSQRRNGRDNILVLVDELERTS